MNRLVVVVDNQAPREGLLCEHGLAVWVEWQGRVILLDTGLGQALVPNLAALELDPGRIEAVVLSHGHYDHGGGLAVLLSAVAPDRKEPLDVWCHPAAFAERYKADASGRKYIGMPLETVRAYTDLGARFRWVEGSVEPWPGVTLLAPVPRRTAWEGDAPGLMVQGPGGVLTPDPFHDDLAMILDGGDGDTVLTGCAHAGVVNILLAAEKDLGRRVGLLVGGTHLGFLPGDWVDRSVGELKARPGLRVAAGHCTGGAVEVLARELGPRFIPLEAGLTLEL